MNPDKSQDDHESVVIPASRNSPDNGIDKRRKTGPDQSVWWYHQNRKRPGERRFSGSVIHVHGAEAERLSGELAAVIRDLPHWVAHQSRAHSPRMVTPHDTLNDRPLPELTRRIAPGSAIVPVHESGPSGLSDYAVSPFGMPTASVAG